MKTIDLFRFCGQETILKSGDVHPQPGPAMDMNGYVDSAERSSRVTYSSNQLTGYGKITNNSQCIDPVLKKHLQDLGILNNRIYTDYCRISSIRTIKHSRRYISKTSRNVDLKRSNLNNCVVILPEGNVKIQRAQYRKTTPMRSITGGYANNHIVQSSETIPVRITERCRTASRQRILTSTMLMLYIFQL